MQVHIVSSFVKYIFGVPEEENIDLLDTLKESSITFIVCHHEIGAAFIAGIMGQLTGQPGVCLSTLSPGFPEIVAKFFSVAVSDRLGAIHIELPNDVASLSVQETPIQSSEISEAKDIESEQIVNGVAKTINKAVRPLVFIGNEAVMVQRTETFIPLRHRFSVIYQKSPTFN